MISEAIRQWKAVLGEGGVADDEVTLARYARTTLDAAPRPVAVLKPRSTQDVHTIVRIASENNVVVYPISRGKNFGYGDACAPTHGAAIIDLSGMDKILEVDVELGYAVIEPGVSQSQLHEYLESHNTGLWFDCTGAGFDASLVGNTVDRGFGHTRYGDHFLTACGMEVVLPDGRILNTGFGHYANARAGRVFRYGVGPFLDGLFCQSNLGIVTKLGLWLMPAPEAFRFFFVRLDRPEDFIPFIDRVRPLRMRGILQSAVHIGNDLRILSSSTGYPWEKTAGATPLPEDVREQLRREAGIGAWSAAGSLTGTRAQVRGATRALRRAMRGLGKVVFVNDAKLALGGFAARCLGAVGLGSRLNAQLEALRPNYGLLKGIPTDEPLLGALWRLRTPPTPKTYDILDAKCGLMWISPVLPMTGRDAKRLLGVVEPIFEQYGFDLLATFTLITERAMIGILNVAFDKREPEEAERARRCYDALMEAVMTAGYYPYRVGLAGLPKLSQGDDVFWQVATQIKAALDPRDILARGRYIPPLAEEKDRESNETD